MATDALDKVAENARELSLDYEPKSPPKKGRHLYKHGLCNHPLYSRWRGMIQRCKDPSSKAYKYYGGRGIYVCERWRSFPNFLEDMGDPMPTDGQMLERIDGEKGYEPSNCKWADRSSQMKNRSNSVVIEFDGEKKNLVDWAKLVGVNVSTLKVRLKKWPIEKAMTRGKFNRKGKVI